MTTSEFSCILNMISIASLFLLFFCLIQDSICFRRKTSLTRMIHQYDSGDEDLSLSSILKCCAHNIKFMAGKM